MPLARLLAVTAAVTADSERRAATDVNKLAAELQLQFPNQSPKELVLLIEEAIKVIEGATRWDTDKASL
jgi:hypothetical protein